MAASMSLRFVKRLFFDKFRQLPSLQGTFHCTTYTNDGKEVGKNKTFDSSFEKLPLDETTQDRTVLTRVPDKGIVTDTSTTGNEMTASSKRDRISKEGQEDVSLSFASMLRKSSLMQIGDFKGSRLIGHINEVQDDDLYIDFGGKFFCVCPRPEPKREYYKGRTVDIILQEWEMSSKFIGSERHTTLLEADAFLIGLSKSKAKTNAGNTSDQLQHDPNYPVNLEKSTV